jgi:hypothetical protein
MNLGTTAAAAAILSLCLCVALPADAASDMLLNGEYTAAGSFGCLTAPGGFNSKLRPNVPANSFAVSGSTEGVWTFNGAGSVSVTAITTFSSVAAAVPSCVYTPSAGGDTSSSNRKYTLGAGDAVTVTAANVRGKYFAGPRTGQTFVTDKFVLAGYASSDGVTVTLATPPPALETITFSTSESYPRICHRSVVLLKH